MGARVESPKIKTFFLFLLLVGALAKGRNCPVGDVRGQAEPWLISIIESYNSLGWKRPLKVI